MSGLMSQLVTDLAAETEIVEQMLAGLTEADWERPTPAEGWAIRDQISHLAFFDQAAALAMTDPERFQAEAAEHIAAGMDFPDRIAVECRSMPVPELHAWFRRARLELITQAGERDPKERVPWYGPAMSVASSVTARIMETWAHGQDIADTLGVTRPATERLKHVAHIGIGARAYSYRVRRLEAPEDPVRVELTAPDGSLWTWGPEDAENRVTGDALEFCLVVTQRRNLAETQLVRTGPIAEQWMTIAQAFAGAAGPGRPAPAAAH
ncbi:TIGR03084 family metal-binding protein [Sporichthya polymorpha]|uniref:TIGR03084 family metal-binding protein n=1 Tax=Sporichthya polymorpha TaxID=35751 RepID=UPI00036A3A70|nr:TIGR03084 family metal-binding protein [Sporichthya polymorpha]